MIKNLLCIGFLSALALPALHAQWQYVDYKLQPGWNSIYLHGDATHATPTQLFATYPEVLEVWRWNANTTPLQFGNAALIPNTAMREWSVWYRTPPGSAVSTLTEMVGQSGYLVRCAANTPANFAATIPQKILPPRSSWVRNGATLLGFPTLLHSSSGTYPTFASYFATFPAAIATLVSKVFRYGGGELGPTNPVQVTSVLNERVDRNQAYWFEAPMVENFYAPLEISPSNLQGLHYGRTGSLLTVRVRNRTSATVTLTVQPVNSSAAPANQEQVTAAVPIKCRVYGANNTYTDESMAGGKNFPIPLQSSLELTFVIDRTSMAGGAVGALYASFLRFTDSGSSMEVLLPATARVTSLAGLWVGDVAVSGVANKSLARYHTCDVTRTSGGVVTKVTSRAAQISANTLAPVSIPTGTGGVLTYQWRKNSLAIADATAGTLVLSAADVIESGAFGATTARPFSLRILLHIDNQSKARLLSQVFLGRLGPTSEDLGLCTHESRLQADAKAGAMRMVAAHLPPDSVADESNGSGSVAVGAELVRVVSLPFDARTNPFLHAYHPDHDNKNERFEAYPSGVESYTVTRTFKFLFTTTQPTLKGTYIEVLDGLHKFEIVDGVPQGSITVTGTFELRRVNEFGAITLGAAP